MPTHPIQGTLCYYLALIKKKLSKVPGGTERACTPEAAWNRAVNYQLPLQRGFSYSLPFPPQMLRMSKRQQKMGQRRGSRVYWDNYTFSYEQGAVNYQLSISLFMAKGSLVGHINDAHIGSRWPKKGSKTQLSVKLLMYILLDVCKS